MQFVTEVGKNTKRLIKDLFISVCVCVFSVCPQ